MEAGSLFDHEKTPFPLTGKHVQVQCESCHKPPADGGAADWVRFEPLPHERCIDCHRDPHGGTLGNRCVECHSTVGWLQIAGERFDHSRTRYPLEGRHRDLACAKCHSEQRKKPAFAACTDCHRDEHGAAQAGRPQWLACDSCHSVQGFRPARYTLEQHQKAAYPLQGAHRAIRCSACHQPAEAPRFELAVAHDDCRTCHVDPHEGRLAKFDPQGSGCLACHDQQDWKTARFDHARTAFALDGAHAVVDCAKCHGERSGRDFGGLKTECASCHKDPHEGRLLVDAAGAARVCDSCHVTRDWFAEKFDHDNDARFALRGGHERVACTACHAPVAEGNDRLLRFKPAPVECRACHTADVDSEFRKEVR